jgi:hypothetical protein
MCIHGCVVMAFDLKLQDILTEHDQMCIPGTGIDSIYA